MLLCLSMRQLSIFFMVFAAGCSSAADLSKHGASQDDDDEWEEEYEVPNLFALSSRGRLVGVKQFDFEQIALPRIYSYDQNWQQPRLHPGRYQRNEGGAPQQLSLMERQARPLFRGVFRRCPTLVLNADGRLQTSQVSVPADAWVYDDSGGFAQVSIGQQMLWISNRCVEVDTAHPDANNFITVEGCGLSRWLPAYQASNVITDDTLLHNALYYLDNCLDAIMPSFRHIPHQMEGLATRYEWVTPEGAQVFFKWSRHLGRGDFSRLFSIAQWVYYIDRDILQFEIVPATVFLPEGVFKGVPDVLIRKWIPGLTDSKFDGTGYNTTYETNQGWLQLLEDNLTISSAWKVAILHFLLGAGDHQGGENIVFTDSDHSFVSYDNEHFDLSSTSGSTLVRLLKEQGHVIQDSETLANLDRIANIPADVIKVYLNGAFGWMSFMFSRPNIDTLYCWFARKLTFLRQYRRFPQSGEMSLDGC